MAKCWKRALYLDAFTVSTISKHRDCIYEHIVQQPRWTVAATAQGTLQEHFCSTTNSAYMPLH